MTPLGTFAPPPRHSLPPSRKQLAQVQALQEATCDAPQPAVVARDAPQLAGVPGDAPQLAGVGGPSLAALTACLRRQLSDTAVNQLTPTAIVASSSDSA